MAELSTRFRFSPQVLVLPLMLAAAILPLRGTLVAGVNWWWDASFRKIDFIMDDAQPNAGSPYISGHLDGSSEPYNLRARMQGETMAVLGVPGEMFAPGKRIPIWDSPDAPGFVAFGADVNGVPVAAMPERPGLVSFVMYLVWLLATFVIGLWALAWVATHWARDSVRRMEFPDRLAKS